MVFSGPIKIKLQKPRVQLGVFCILDFNFNFLFRPRVFHFLVHRYKKKKERKRKDKKSAGKEHICLYSQNFSLSMEFFSAFISSAAWPLTTVRPSQMSSPLSPPTPNFFPFLWRWWPVPDFSRFLNIPTGLSGSWVCTYLVRETSLWVMGDWTRVRHLPGGCCPVSHSVFPLGMWTWHQRSLDMITLTHLPSCFFSILPVRDVSWALYTFLQPTVTPTLRYTTLWQYHKMPYTLHHFPHHIVLIPCVFSTNP